MIMYRSWSIISHFQSYILCHYNKISMEDIRLQKSKFQIMKFRNQEKGLQKNKHQGNPEIKDNSQYVLNDMIDSNSAYFRQKVHISQFKTPNKYRFKLPTKTGSTEYSKQYTHSLNFYNIKGASPSRKKMKSLIKLPNYAITQSSNYKKDYISTKTQQSLESIRPQIQSFKKPRISFEGPLFTEPSRYKQYASKSIDDNVGMKVMPTLMTFGGKFQEETTYNKAYLNIKQNPAELISPKNHHVFTQITRQKQSNYKETYKNHSKHPFLSSILKQSLQTKYKPIPIIAHKKLKSQYSNSYIEQLSTQKRQFQRLSQFQLKQFLLSNINKN